MHKLKILGEGNLNLINQWGGGTTKRVGRPNFEISVGEAKGGNKIFDSNLVGGSWRKLHDLLVELYNTNWFKSGE